ncbi:MAG: hypothetical protein EBR93_05925, partial [Bacteroidetes bacterium]|nr:hypothetical protein [Bacteroidota bacterium]
MSNQIIENILTDEEVYAFTTHPTVLSAFERVGSHAATYSFLIPVDDRMRAHLIEKLNLRDLPIGGVPMRWIRGDTSDHIDQTASKESFARTHLIYLTDSTGHLRIDGSEYDIKANTAHIFDEGLSHETIGTSMSSPRLLLGPMNESGVAVGIAGPILSSISPISGSVSGGYTMTITGNGFQYPYNLVVNIAGTVVTPTILSNELLTVVVPAIDDAGICAVYLTYQDFGSNSNSIS